MTPQPPAAEKIVSKEEKIEYRDQDGNILNEEQVANLDGKVSFNTKYETRTRVIDAEGNEIDDGLPASSGSGGPPAGGAEGGYAPPHPDVERQPETVKGEEKDGEGEKRDYPATASPEEDVAKEKSVERKEGKAAKPASEGGKATKGEL